MAKRNRRPFQQTAIAAAAHTAAQAAPAPELDSEFANRLRDPFEQTYMGVLQTNDPLLLERGNGGVEIYRDLRRDPAVFTNLQKRVLALVGKEWTVEAVDESAPGAAAATEEVADMLKQCAFDKLCAELMEALLAGWAVAEIVPTVRDTPRGQRIVPARIVKRAPRRFKFVQQDENTAPKLHLLTRENMLTGVPVPERKFIVHRVNPEDDNPYGTGLGLQLYWPVFFKRKGIVAWNKLNDRFGSPTPHGKYPNNADPKAKGTLAGALRAMSNDGFLMTPDGMTVELLESKLTGSVTTQQALCEYMDDWIAGILTGQEPRGKAGGALGAASKERENVREDLTQADSDLLSETLNSTLLAWYCEWNGLPPCLVYRKVKQGEDLKALAETDKAVSELGYELDEAAVRSKYGDGWSKKKPLPQAGLVAPDIAIPAQPNFAEAQALSTPAQGMAPQLARNLAPVVGGWLDQVRDLVMRASSLEEIRDGLAQLLPGMTLDQYAAAMAEALRAAQLAGRFEVLQEAGGRM